MHHHVPRSGEVTYRLALIGTDANSVFVEGDGPRYVLPKVVTLEGTRPAKEIQRVVRECWKSVCAVVDFCHDRAGLPLCIAEQLKQVNQNHLHKVPLSQLPESELAGRDREVIRAIMAGEAGERGPLSCLGWSKKAAQWITDETGFMVLPFAIEQHNANGSFALAQFKVENGPAFWLKATGEPNQHEFPITGTLAKLCPRFTPRVISMRKDWNAWLMADAGDPIKEDCSPDLLGVVARSVADLQIGTIPHINELLSAGVADQRIPVLQSEISEIVVFLEEAMATQVSKKVAPLSRSRLREIGLMLEDACSRVAALDVPNTLLHNDLNRTNILVRDHECSLIDWAEACVGIPFISLEQLLLMAGEEHAAIDQRHISEAYKQSWMEAVDEWKMDTALALMPLLAPYAHLYGRGDWVRTSHRNHPRVQSYARTLARHMDRAATNPTLQDVLFGSRASSVQTARPRRGRR